ncbi:P1-P2 fusion protein [Ageratum virus 2]|nr:P1-P2 fusion protein [Ageratum virus 2]
MSPMNPTATTTGTAALSWAIALLLLWLFTGPTPALAHGGTTSDWNQSASYEVSCSWVCQVPLPHSEAMQPDWAASWLNQSGGIPVRRPCHSEQSKCSPTLLPGHWLALTEHNGSLILSLRLPQVLRQWQDSLARSAKPIHDGLLTFWRVAVAMPSYFIKSFGHGVIALAEFVERGIFMWISSLLYMLWQLVKISPRRMITFLAALFTASYVWTGRTFYVPLRIALFPVWAMVYPLQFLLKNLCWGVVSCSWSLISSLPSWASTSMKRRKKKALKMRSKFSLKKEKKMKTKERALNGFKPTFLPGTPPRGVIGEALDSLGARIGYFSCVKLQGGGRALMTAAHVWKDATSFQGPAGKIRKEEASIVMGSKKLDFILFEGPLNWGSLMGMSAKPLFTTDKLSRGQHVMYINREGSWKAQVCNLLSFECDGFVPTECLTIPGDSGLPIFDPKGSRVVAMHVGSYTETENNRATAIPPIPNFTVPDTQYYKPVESLYIANKLVDLQEDFDAPEIDVIVGDTLFSVKTKKGAISVAKEKPLSSQWVPKSGMYWADYEDDEDLESKKHPKPSSGSKNRGREQAAGSGIRCCGPPHTTRTSNDTRRSLCPSTEEGANCGGTRQKSAQQGKARRKEDRNHPPSAWIARREPYSSRRPGQTCETSRRDDLCPGEVPYSRTPLEEIFRDFYSWKEPKQGPPGFEFVGSCPFTKFKTEVGGLSTWGQSRVSNSPFLENCCSQFGWPETGAQAELSSLAYQAARRLAAQNKATVPHPALREDVIQRTVLAYRAAAVEADRWTLDLDERHMRIAFADCVRSMKADAGCGVPFAGYNNQTTHGDWCFDDESYHNLESLVFARLHRLRTINFSDPVQAVRDGLCDPVRLFVKPEPHKREKIANKRYRLIASISIADQLVARMLFRLQNERELELHMQIPSKPGLGFSKDEQVLSFVEQVASLASTTPEQLVASWPSYIIPTDCSGFDWSVQAWMLEDELEVRNRLTLNLSPELRRMRAGWLRCLSQSVFCLSSGVLLAQTEPGIQKSGSFNTSSTNSRVRFMASLYAGAPWCVTMGDDALEGVGSDLSVYEGLGLKCERADEFDFCSHIFQAPHKVIPKNISKMIFNLLCGVSPAHQSLKDRSTWWQAFGSIDEEMRHLPEASRREIYEALGVQFPC